MKKMIKIVLLILAVPVLYVLGTVLLAAVTKFKPKKVEDVTMQKSESREQKTEIPTDSTLSFLTWNIGYGGLGAETDFFYDGGKMVTSPEAWVKRYTQGIFDFAKENAATDFLFFQEVDRKGKRSWNIDEVKGIASGLPNHNYAFTVNYDVKYLPFPWTNPMGRIYGGLLNCTNYMPVESKRIALPGITDFPRKLVYLERCLLIQRFKVANGKELVAINTHFEAYDDGGIKKQQMELTKKIMEAEYAKGNYVVLGGDWNIAPPDFDVKKWEKEKNDDVLYELKNDPNYISDWKYASDNNTPTNRKNSHAFDPATTYTTVIDYFFVSPNVEVIEVKGVDAGFKNSDHNPVKMKIRLK